MSVQYYATALFVYKTFFSVCPTMAARVSLNVWAKGHIFITTKITMSKMSDVVKMYSSLLIF